MKEKIRNFVYRLKIFGWYLSTEPFRQFWYLIRDIGRTLSKTYAWIYILLFSGILLLLFGKRPLAGMILIVLLLAILLWEWESGMFMHRYRQKIIKKLNKEVDKNGEFGNNIKRI